MGYSGTAGMYGVISNPPVYKTSLVNPEFPYQEAKLEDEAFVLVSLKNHQLLVVIARFLGCGDNCALSL
jgi:UDP-glucose 4-epimerase